jgi:hypothetical protein
VHTKGSHTTVHFVIEVTVFVSPAAPGGPCKPRGPSLPVKPVGPRAPWEPEAPGGPIAFDNQFCIRNNQDDTNLVIRGILPSGPTGPAGPTGPGSAGKRVNGVCATIPMGLAGDFVGVGPGVTPVGLLLGMTELFATFITVASFTNALSTKSASIMGTGSVEGPDRGVTVVDPLGIRLALALCFADLGLTCPVFGMTIALSSISPSLLMSCAARRHRPSAPPQD